MPDTMMLGFVDPMFLVGLGVASYALWKWRSRFRDPRQREREAKERELARRRGRIRVGPRSWGQNGEPR